MPASSWHHQHQEHPLLPDMRSASCLHLIRAPSRAPPHHVPHMESPAHWSAPRHSDLILYVGKNRTPYTLSIENLQGSSYFKALLDERLQADPANSSLPPVVIDCEESVFRNMITIMRYGSFAALPKMSEPEIFKLRRELEFYGIDVSDFPSRNTSSISSSASSPASSPVSTSPRASSEATRLSHFSLAELSGFPAELTDPSKLVLVSRLDDDIRGRCPCSANEKPNVWALNFYHRHAFCTACGRPTASMAPKFVAEMFMVATAYFSGEKLDPKKWSVGCDSTCTLKFASSNTCCSCSCSSKHSVWAASTYHLHAFCTQCAKSAEGPALVCILLTLRFGSHHRSPKGSKRDNHVEFPITRETLSAQTDHCRTPSRTPSYASQKFT